MREITINGKNFSVKAHDTDGLKAEIFGNPVTLPS